MSFPDDDPRPTESEDGQELPVLILPATGGTYTQGLGVGFGAINAGNIAPPPITDAEGGGGFDNLASRIERVLSEDGRFSPLIETLTVAADEDGHVVVTGPPPDPLLKRSLLATLHAIPGVTDVTDETH